MKKAQQEQMRRQQAPLARRGKLTAAMKTTSSSKTIGLDLGDRGHAVCVLDAQGEILAQEASPTPARA